MGKFPTEEWWWENEPNRTPMEIILLNGMFAGVIGFFAYIMTFNWAFNEGEDFRAILVTLSVWVIFAFLATNVVIAGIVLWYDLRRRYREWRNGH